MRNTSTTMLRASAGWCIVHMIQRGVSLVILFLVRFYSVITTTCPRGASALSLSTTTCVVWYRFSHRMHLHFISFFKSSGGLVLLKLKFQHFHVSDACRVYILPDAPVATVACTAAIVRVNMTTRPDPGISSAVEIATWRRPRLREVWDLCKLSHQQKPSLIVWSLSARLGPVTVYPTRWGVRLHIIRMCDYCTNLYVLRTYVTRVIATVFLPEFLVHVFLSFYACCPGLWFEGVRHVCGANARGNVPSTQPTKKALSWSRADCGTLPCALFSDAVRDQVCYFYRPHAV